jgi:hypothetical protein
LVISEHYFEYLKICDWKTIYTIINYEICEARDWNNSQKYYGKQFTCYFSAAKCMYTFDQLQLARRTTESLIINHKFCTFIFYCMYENICIWLAERMYIKNLFVLSLSLSGSFAGCLLFVVNPIKDLCARTSSRN